MNAFSTICLDVGSCYTRIGPCGDDMPRKQFFTEVDSVTGEVGYSCERKDAVKAVQKGHVVDTNAMEKIWGYSVNSMRQFCNPNVNPGVLVNFRPDMTNNEKKHLAEFMFETLEVSCVGTGEEGPLSLYAAGRGSGFMLHSGDGCTHFSSIIESRYSAKPQVLDIPCGADLTEIVRNAIRQQYCEITTEQARLIKESLVNNCEEYELPNGTKIEISRVKALVEHALFDEAKLHEKIHRYIELSNEFQRSTLYYNVILSGGNTLFDCFGKDALWKRMNKVETNSLLCDTRRGNIVTPLDRDLSIWIGGSILGSLSTIQYSGLNIRKEEYEEKGAERFYLNNTMLDEL